MKVDLSHIKRTLVSVYVSSGIKVTLVNQQPHQVVECQGIDWATDSWDAMYEVLGDGCFDIALVFFGTEFEFFTESGGGNSLVGVTED